MIINELIASNKPFFLSTGIKVLEEFLIDLGWRRPPRCDLKMRYKLHMVTDNISFYTKLIKSSICGILCI